jgi:2-polyprenyl-6-methoxyphenol hydroxylase-like FAD-dependent oxidoreductase
MHDVLIVGAGPVGLMLASELALQGARPLVVERLAAPTGLSKALGVQGRGVELLEARGLLPRFPQDRPAGLGLHFSGIPLDVTRLPKRRPSFLFVPQARTEAILEARARELGVEIRRGHELAALDESADGVRARLTTTAGEVTLTARFVVGCDGGRSTVRKLLGIDFPGSEPTMLWRMADVRLPGAAIGPGGIILPGGAPAPLGVGVPLEDGYFRITSREPFAAGFERETPMTLDEFSASVERSHGIRLAMTEPRWLTRFTDSSRQAVSYRKGSVFLAGDACHTHLPAGGPGISTGINDAANLAWKLGAALQGWAPPSLLDTYHAERHAAGARVLLHTRAQAALMTPTANVQAMRMLLAELMQLPSALTHVADLVQGIDVRYAAGAHPAVGRWTPVPVEQQRARPLLLDGSREHVASGWARPWRDRIEMRAFAHETLAALLIRPDGYVAWAADREALDRSDFEAAARAWFGEPR